MLVNYIGHYVFIQNYINYAFYPNKFPNKLRISIKLNSHLFLAGYVVPKVTKKMKFDSLLSSLSYFLSNKKTLLMFVIKGLKMRSDYWKHARVPMSTKSFIG